ncbi:MAG TPA: hypothetical protein VGM05_06420 [Planctomycetaceae bacterium]
MKTYTAIIYHCVTCGRVEHSELESAAPRCCGSEMTKAAEETIRKPEADEPGGTEDAAKKTNRKPAK